MSKQSQKENNVHWPLCDNFWFEIQAWVSFIIFIEHICIYITLIIDNDDKYGKLFSIKLYIDWWMDSR